MASQASQWMTLGPMLLSQRALICAIAYKRALATRSIRGGHAVHEHQLALRAMKFPSRSLTRSGLLAGGYLKPIARWHRPISVVDFTRACFRAAAPQQASPRQSRRRGKAIGCCFSGSHLCQKAFFGSRQFKVRHARDTGSQAVYWGKWMYPWMAPLRC